MSEEKKRLEAIKSDEVVKVEMPTNLYQRINQYIVEMFPIKDEEHFINLIKNVSEGKEEEDRLTYHLKTLITIQMIIEKACREQDLIEYIDEESVKDLQDDSNTEENQSSPQ